MLLTILLCAGLIGIDQLLKLWAVKSLAPVGAMPLIPHVMELRYVENNGAAFNLLSGRQVLLIVFTGAILLAGAYILLFRRPKDKLEYAAYVMVFSGGVGNLIDRIANGYVVDYLATLFINFAVFNFADILVCVGVALLVIAVFRAEGKERRLKKQSEDKAPAEGLADTNAEADLTNNHGEN